MESFLDIEGGGGIAIPYIGYVEVYLKFPEIQTFDEDVLMMVMNQDIKIWGYGSLCYWNHTYSCSIKSDNRSRMENLSLSRRCAALPAYTSKMAEMENFSLDSVKGDVKVHNITMLPPFSTTFVKGRSTVKGHHKRVNVATKHSDKVKNSNIATVRSYSFSWF